MLQVKILLLAMVLCTVSRDEEPWKRQEQKFHLVFTGAYLFFILYM